MKKSFKDFVKEIEESNEEFLKMTPAQKRVQIAKDAIERIKLGQLRSQRRVTVSIHDDGEKDSLKELLNTEIVRCDVCAKGGLFLAYVGRVNEFRTDDIDNRSSLNSKEMEKLLEIFDPLQLNGIEAAFERVNVCHEFSEGSEEDNEFIKACSRYTLFEDWNMEQVMFSICRNIIKHDGEFNPFDVVDPELEDQLIK